MTIDQLLCAVADELQECVSDSYCAKDDHEFSIADREAMASLIKLLRTADRQLNGPLLHDELNNKELFTRLENSAERYAIIDEQYLEDEF